MKRSPLRIPWCCLTAGLCLVSSGYGQVLFEDDFDSGASGEAWLSNSSGGDGLADFAFDYSTLGIPAAPRSNGTTIGLGFTVNLFAGQFSGMSASPIDAEFLDDFEMSFDLWLNFIGPFPGGGNGSTQFATFGWGTGGTTAQWAGATHSLLFATSLDGGAASDYRIYGAAGGAPLAPATGFYAAGTLSAPDSRNNVDPYYASFGGESAPDAQLALYPGQTGATTVGSLGMKWREVVIRKAGGNLSWTVDGVLIATVPLETFGVGGSNLVLGMFDSNAGSSTDPNNFLNTAIFDNVVVTGLTVPAAALELSNPQVEGGEFSFDISGPAGWVVTVEASGDLSDWAPKGTVTLGAAPYHYTVPLVPAGFNRFYRVRHP